MNFMQLPKQYHRLNHDAEQVEELLYQTLLDADDLIKEQSIQLLKSGGKRIRPLLCLISSCFGSNSPTLRIRSAAVLELIHMASLVHDDMIDCAPIRRGQPTIHQKYNNQVATRIGDYIFATALEQIATIKDVKIHNLLAYTLNQLSVGELEQLRSRYSIDLSVKNYLRKIRNKTALLIATCCKMGAMIGQTTEKLQRHLYFYGYYLGMSYQIIDDILDFTQSEQQLGKPNGQDLVEGYITLPTLIALEDRSLYSDLAQLYQYYDRNKPSDYQVIIDQIKRTNAIEQSKRIANQYLNKAINIVKQLPNQAEKQLLMQMAAYLSQRSY